MKLRIRGDSVRLRLTQAEVATLAEKGLVEESIAFGSQPNERLTYAIAFGGSSLSAKLESTRVEITALPDVIRAWAGSDAIGVEGAQDVGDGRILRILVEKDFACLTERPHEHDADAFPNPKKEH